ncbi:AMY1C-like protein, partial [Mya arenaria]
SVIVHLFEWKWTDIKLECDRFLGPKGYCGVQISPPNENAVITNTTFIFDWATRPWWERYQPVSYNLVTRSGDAQEFREMVETCNHAGVRIYVDAVINHMTANFSGVGTDGSSFDAHVCSYPTVPYTQVNCNGQDVCGTDDGVIHDYNNEKEARDCSLFGLVDLALGTDDVRRKIASYLNTLIDIGVAGFRIDAAKHMWPGDLSVLFSRLNDLKTEYFGTGKRSFIYQEIIEFKTSKAFSKQYVQTGRVTNFQYGMDMAEIFLRDNLNLSQFVPTLESYLPSEDSLVFISNHDNQRTNGSEAHISLIRVGKEIKMKRSSPAISFFDEKAYVLATGLMLAHPYGVPRVMSSYRWNRHFENGEDKNNWQGPPHNADMSTANVVINDDLSCAGDWKVLRVQSPEYSFSQVCEHRWTPIFKMVNFRNVVHGSPLQNWQSTTPNQMAFSRGNRGFFAIVSDNSILNEKLNTGLPVGTYCDVISGDYVNSACTGKTIHVDATGRAHVHINGNSATPMIAIH